MNRSNLIVEHVWNVLDSHCQLVKMLGDVDLLLIKRPAWVILRRQAKLKAQLLRVQMLEPR